MSFRRLNAIAGLLIREMRTLPEHTYGSFHVGVRAARGAPWALGGRQCCRLFRWRPQVFGLSAAAVQGCSDGLKPRVGFRVSGINPDGLLVALDG